LRPIGQTIEMNHHQGCWSQLGHLRHLELQRHFDRLHHLDRLHQLGHLRRFGLLRHLDRQHHPDLRHLLVGLASDPVHHPDRLPRLNPTLKPTSRTTSVRQTEPGTCIACLF
jgi:hypothetical protein